MAQQNATKIKIRRTDNAQGKYIESGEFLLDKSKGLLYVGIPQDENKQDGTPSKVEITEDLKAINEVTVGVDQNNETYIQIGPDEDNRATFTTDLNLTWGNF